ncbi:MAPEG family protein [Natronospira bacteriovora]|uniref:MAPEG family protein n=1 Tax=Natronospira bacteriovora TaxID=3069753 RepID=A0ABU0W7B2_9GAMM|nr:MAPEG family protein [Natronospira sp. AB-CW4]MDQ2069912.1 MAPEG family protein [Natronospira sp. AB-CW4]
MSHSVIALIGIIGWTFLLIFINELMRSWLVLARRKDPGTFQPDGLDVSPFAHRLARAHANCYESFPLIGGVLLLAIATGHTAITDTLALWLLAARIIQSSIHLASISGPAVTARFVFYFIQLLIVGWWLIGFACEYLV